MIFRLSWFEFIRALKLYVVHLLINLVRMSWDEFSVVWIAEGMFFSVLQIYLQHFVALLSEQNFNAFTLFGALDAVDWFDKWDSVCLSRFFSLPSAKPITVLFENVQLRQPKRLSPSLSSSNLFNCYEKKHFIGSLHVCWHATSSFWLKAKVKDSFDKVNRFL